MFRIVIIPLFIFVFLQECISQDIRLRKDCYIDTLHVALTFSEGTSDVLQYHMRAILDSVVLDFNNEKTQFQLVVDSTSRRNSMRVNMSVVDYVNKKRNLSFTAMNLVFVAGTIYINAMTGYIIPFLMFPHASINMDVTLSPDLSVTSAHMNSFASGNGFWLKPEAQDIRILYGFAASIEEIIRKTHARYAKVRKKQDRRARKENVALAISSL